MDRQLTFRTLFALALVAVTAIMVSVWIVRRDTHLQKLNQPRDTL